MGATVEAMAPTLVLMPCTSPSSRSSAARVITDCRVGIVSAIATFTTNDATRNQVTEVGMRTITSEIGNSVSPRGQGADVAERFLDQAQGNHLIEDEERTNREQKQTGVRLADPKPVDVPEHQDCRVAAERHRECRLHPEQPSERASAGQMPRPGQQVQLMERI